jgi:AcrR family transcriptional regulator
MSNPSPLNTRDALLEATIVELAKVGSDAVEIGLICRTLNISPSLVNHYFGSRSLLIIEAAMVGYERYVDQQVEVVRAAGDDPVVQFRAWLEAQVDWTMRNPGIASVMNFPSLHLPEGESLGVEARLRLEGAATRNLITLASVLDRAQRGARGNEELTREAVAKNLGLASATAYVGWLAYGHSLWRAGRHAPTSDLPEVRRFEEAVFAALPKVALQIASTLSGHADS